MPVGLMVTLRKKMMYSFLERFVNLITYQELETLEVYQLSILMVVVTIILV